MLAGSGTRRAQRLCSLASRANGEDPAGSATLLQARLIVEMAQPWQRKILDSRHAVKGLRQVVQGAQESGLLGVFAAVLPDREYSRKGHTRCLFLRRPAGP